jgi:hypothetical protein
MLHKLAIIFAVALFATNAFATSAAVYSTNAIGTATLSGFSPTRQVSVGYVSAGTSPNFDRYSISAKHLQGNKVYGTTSAQTSNFQKDGAAGTVLGTGDIPGAPSSASDSTIPSGWSAM